VNGTIRPYTDAGGRQQTAVDGPHGTFLITRKNDREAFEVWKSDSLNAIYRTSDAALALQKACKAAGVGI
jgi:hypothetical protein